MKTRIWLPLIGGMAAFSAAPAADRELCDSMAGLAGAIMEGRQKGAEMADMLGAVKSTDPAVTKLREQFIISAYEQPQFASEEYRQKAVVDFKNTVFLECFKAGRDD